MPSTSVYLVLPRADRLDGGLLHEIGRIEVWLASRQSDHIDTRTLQRGDAAGHRQASAMV